jgi:hypothetical protein
MTFGTSDNNKYNYLQFIYLFVQYSYYVLPKLDCLVQSTVAIGTLYTYKCRNDNIFAFVSLLIVEAQRSIF